MGKGVACIGDSISCGDFIAEGSPNVNVGGKPVALVRE
jgi:uncharacterized Zn-binding protein involved in type VI secretion